MRSLISWGILALLAINGIAADNAAALPALAKVTMRNGQVYFGEIKPQRSRTYVVITDLVTGKEQKLIKALVDRVDQPVPDDEVASACGVDVLTAWKARAIARGCMASTDVGKIARIDDGTIFITGNQAAVDDKLQVYRTTQIIDPDTKKAIGTDTKILAELRVTDVSSGFIKAQPEGGRPRLDVGQPVRTEPEPLPVVTFAADTDSAGAADKLILDQIAVKLASGDVPVADSAQTAAAMAATHVSPADGVNPSAMQKFGQKMGASAIIVAHGAGTNGGVQITVIDVAAGTTAMSQLAPAPASIQNATALTLTISMHVDGKDAVEIGSDSLTVHHLDAAQPQNIKINGLAAEPGKTMDNRGPTAYLSPKADIASARLVSQSGRGKIALDHGPDGQVTLTFDDPDPGSSDYSATLRFVEKGAPLVGLNPPGPANPPSPFPPAPAAEVGPAASGLFALAGQGLPQYLTCDDNLSAEGDGVTGGRAHTTRTDFGEHDFVLDVVFEFPPGDSRNEATIGIGEPDRGVGVRLRPIANGANASLRFDRRNQDPAWVKYGSAGPHLLRLEKIGDTLTCSMTYNYAGHYRPDAVGKVASIKREFAGMNRLNSPLYIDGGAIFTAIGIRVDGQPLGAGPGLPPVVEPAADQGWVSFVPGAGLPPGMAANPNVNIAADGLCFSGEPCLLSTGRDFIDKDFTLDLVYHFGPDANGSLIAGIGDPADFQHRIYLEISSPTRDGVVTLASGGHRRDVATMHHDHPGPNMVRIQKRGDTLSIALCVDYKDKFAPDIVKMLPSLKAVGASFTAANSPLFLGGTARIDKARFLIAGEPIPQIAAVPPGDTKVSNLVKITGPEMPSFLVQQRDLDFSHGGVSLLDKQIRSREGLLDKDFTADLLVTPPDDWHTMRIGVGAGENSGGANWLDKSAYVNITAPGMGSAVELGLTHMGQEMGKYSGQGPHLLRVEKRGNTLTFSFCVNYTGSFHPDFVRSIPDLRAVVPDLTESNCHFFMDGGGVLQAIAFSINGEAKDSNVVALQVPPAIAEGKPVSVQIAKAAGASTFAAGESVPDGLSVSPSGQLTWTPTHAQVGPHEFQIKITAQGKTIAETVRITVVSAADAGTLHGNLAQLDSLYTLPIKQEKHYVTAGLDRSLLLLDGDSLRRLGSDGFTVKETLQLPKAYEWIGERGTYFVALSQEGKCLDLIDKSTLKVRRSLQMQYFGLHDLCLVPDRDICYVMVEKSTGDGLDPQILIVNETTGDVHEPDDFGGTWGKTSPDGKKLFVAYKDTYQKGDRLLFNPDHIDVVPDYGDIDILMVYDISHPSSPTLISAKNEAGANGFGIAVSGDGSKVSYLSFVGYPLYSKNIAAWDPADLTKRPVSYPTKDNKGDCKFLAFHPILPIAAVAAESGAICFDQNTGELQADRLDFGPALGEVKVSGLIFSPDGKNLLLDCAAENKCFLRRVKLNLSADELKQIERGPVAPFEPRQHTGPIGPKASAEGSPSMQFAQALSNPDYSPRG